VTPEGIIQDIVLKEPEESMPYWMLIFFILPVMGVYLYKRYRKNPVSPSYEPSVSDQVNPAEEALARLENAVRMFNSGLEKEAYSEISGAVRIYYRGKLGIHELTSEEILDTVRGSKDKDHMEEIRQCFKLCDLVKFAKYEPNPEDFNKAVEYAKRIIV
jgi:hypothetical protein